MRLNNNIEHLGLRVFSEQGCFLVDGRELFCNNSGKMSGLTCNTAPGVTFSTMEELKAHYKTDWHRYNLKRKVNALTLFLPHPISPTVFT